MDGAQQVEWDDDQVALGLQAVDDGYDGLLLQVVQYGKSGSVEEFD
ncbi:hypothetical protein ACFFQW_48755 [Umezawaea endophytica]